MAGQKRKIGILRIKKALTSCALDPEKPGWFKIVGEADDDYLLRRSIEFLTTGLQVDGVSLNDSLSKTIALLGLVKARIDESI